MATALGPIPVTDIKSMATMQRARMGGYTAVPPAVPAQPTTKSDPFYGHETTSRLCARFITHLFACPEYPPTSTHSQAKLPYFIAYALHRTKLHASVTFAALVLLQRLKARFPTARVICDDTYSNKSWSIVAQGMFTLREINQMEREMCSYLDWELTVDNPILANFETMVKRDFRGPGPYPTYSLQLVSKRAIKAAASTSNTPVPPPHTTTTSPIPVFGQQQQQQQQRQASPPKPAYINTNVTYSSPPTPDTPSSSYSTSSTPASEALPTPPNRESHFVKVYDDSMPAFTIRQVAERPPPIHPLKGKMFAFALPSVW
ncbi:Cyclin-like protein [Pleurotus pulmonarius]